MHDGLNNDLKKPRERGSYRNAKKMMIEALQSMGRLDAWALQRRPTVEDCEYSANNIFSRTTLEIKESLADPKKDKHETTFHPHNLW